MRFSKNQHVISQWILRNFRSDNTATLAKDKQRVWVHTVYKDPKRNDIKSIPLPISNVGVGRNCFLFQDSNGNKFDLEDELSEYEHRTSIIINDLVENHSFENLLDINDTINCSMNVIINFMIIQMILGLNNPQNKNKLKEEVLNSLIKDIEENLEDLEKSIKSIPDELSFVKSDGIYKKIVSVIESSSSKYDKSKGLLFLFILMEAKGLPTLFPVLQPFKKNTFNGIYISGIYHTGHDFLSTQPRPVFAIGPNIFVYVEQNSEFLLPISHNIMISFRTNFYFNKKINIYSANPEKLLCKISDKLSIYHVSYDYIDNMVSWLLICNNGYSNTIYSPHEEKDVNAYLDLQVKNEKEFYLPKKPVLWK